ncbi:2-hydroxyacyl-CoA dehydratase [bacterium]|nr:2-hydroxyacyl-CoA dehydratase [bacterium]
MIDTPLLLSIHDWDARYDDLMARDLVEAGYGGRLSRHLDGGDYRLNQLLFDNSAASLRLWNFLLTEEARLAAARADGHTLVGAMKDLGTIPVMAYALPNVTAFYPDGAWWIPCVMELSAGLLSIADRMGIDESFCPVRAMLGAFVSEAHFPIPDLLICSVGATCDDFSAIAQRLQGLGYPILWWEAVHRRQADKGEDSVILPGGFAAPVAQVDFIQTELVRIKQALERQVGHLLSDEDLLKGISVANGVRCILQKLRFISFTAPMAPLPALELLIAEMLAIHYCSDQAESLVVLQDLYDLAKSRVDLGLGHGHIDDARIFWVNPVADLTAMNLLETCGGRICGTEYLFSHALDLIPEDLPPMEALARTALADPMIGSARQRAERITFDMQLFGAEGLIISKIPGASHCALESEVIRENIEESLGLPVIEIEVPPVCDALRSSLKTRIEALVETIKSRRK